MTLGLVQFEPTQCHHEVFEYNVAFQLGNNGNNSPWAYAKVQSETLHIELILHLLPLGLKTNQFKSK
jgi:hypothetical protein